MNLLRRISNVFAALRGDAVDRVSDRDEFIDRGSGCPSRLAHLEMDIADRDDRIAALLHEIEEREARAHSDADIVASSRLRNLLGQLAPILAQADAMRRAHDTGNEIRVADALALMGRIEKVLAAEGVARIGITGATTAFDPQVHQPLGDASLRPGDIVRIRFIGFRYLEHILAKAFVGPKE